MDERKFPKLILDQAPKVFDLTDAKPKEFTKPLTPIDQAQGTPVYEFILGEFTIRFKTGGIWLERDTGEGMELKPGKLEKLLKRYWEKEF